jgi:4-amino-4-deoxy-L-arabinose transferase-like glycosyltransferase
MRLVARPVLQLLVVSTVVHAGVMLTTTVRTGRADSYAFKSLDCNEFYAIARNLAEHGAFSRNESPPLVPDTWRTPGYPLFLATFMFLFGRSPTMLVAVQQLLSILNVLLLFSIARLWMTDRRALAAAVLFLLEPYHLYYSLWLMSATWFTTVLLLVWLVWQRTFQAPRWGWLALLGALSGALVLVRPVGGLVPVAVLLGLIVAVVREKRQRADNRGRTNLIAASRLAAFVAACTLVVASWMIRNDFVAGHFALSDQGGVVLAYFKGTEVTLWREGRATERYVETSLDPAHRDRPHPVWEGIDARLRGKFNSLAEGQRAMLRWPNLAQGNKTKIDSFAVSEALSEIGWSDLTASPLSTAVCSLVRCGSILTFPLNLALRPATGVEVGRLESALKGSVYLLLCVWVVVRLLRGGLTFERVYFPLACTIALLLATTPQLDPRFRVPMIPLLVVIALLPRRREPRGKPLLKSH